MFVGNGWVPNHCICFMMRSKRNRYNGPFYGHSQHAGVSGRPSCTVVSFVPTGETRQTNGYASVGVVSFYSWSLKRRVDYWLAPPPLNWVNLHTWLYMHRIAVF